MFLKLSNFQYPDLGHNKTIVLQSQQILTWKLANLLRRTTEINFILIFNFSFFYFSAFLRSIKWLAGKLRLYS